MPQEIDPQLKSQLLSATFRPAIALWNRLEGRARQEEFERSLRVEIRDPLWMLTRQWQVGEFKGEDAGSAAKVRAQVSTAPVNRFAVKPEDREAENGADWLPAITCDTSMPLETRVEHEPVWENGTTFALDSLALRGQLGRHFLRLLRLAGLQAHRNTIVDQFGFPDLAHGPDASEPELLETAQVESDAAAWQVLQSFQHRLPDGRRLLRAIADGEFESWVAAEFDAAIQQHLNDLTSNFRSSFLRTYSQPEGAGEDAWTASYLEYQFAVSSPADESNTKRTTLVAEQYHSGHLDWHAFDLDPFEQLEDATPGEPGAGLESGKPLAVVPTQIEFSGMPNVRWWELEDRRTDFGNIRAGTVDVPLLLLAEFGLVYGNDWSVIPWNLPVGTLADIRGLIVTDVFGVRTLIRAAGEAQGMDWQRWSMYGLTSRASNQDAADRRLFLAPAVAKTQEGDPIEKIILARDEMTNMVWAVEERIPGVLGHGSDGFEAATALSRYFSERADDSDVVPLPTTADIRYLLGTSVPENWIPFLPRHRPGSQRLIRLQRASMPRLTDALPFTRVEPRGRVLRSGLDTLEVRRPYFLHEEEVPRAGVIVTRGFQRARWFDGKVYTWLGRQKQTGRGQGASGLVFDRVVPVKAQTNTP